MLDGTVNGQGRHNVGDDIHSIGVVHDDPRTGALLWRSSEDPECLVDTDAMLRHYLYSVTSLVLGWL
jgi:hypothetical protein